MLAQRPKVYNGAEELTARYRGQYIGLYDKNTGEITPVKVAAFSSKNGRLQVASTDATYEIGDEFEGNEDVVPIWDAPALGWAQTRAGACYVISNTNRQYLRGFHTNLLLFNGKIFKEPEADTEEYRQMVGRWRRANSLEERQKLETELNRMDKDGSRFTYSYSAMQKDKMDRNIGKVAPFFYNPSYVNSSARLHRLLAAGKSAALNRHIAIIPAIDDKSPTVVMFGDNTIGTYDSATGEAVVPELELFVEYFPDWLKVKNAA